MPVSYNKKNMEEASSYFKPSEGQKKMEEGLSSAWNKVKGLVGGGSDDAMGEALKKRKEKLGDE